MKRKNIMDASDISRASTRLAHELIERNKGAADLVLIGIQRRGVPLAKRVADLVRQFEGVEIPVGMLDITFYRDDLSMLAEHPVINGTDIPFMIEAVMEAGRPKCIQLMVMIDRGHRELPIRADFVGRNLPTSHNEIVHVCEECFDGESGVYIETVG